MKKQVVALVVSLILVIVLIGVLVYLLTNRTAQDSLTVGESSQQNLSHTITLKNLETSDLNSIKVTNSTGSYTLINLGDTFGVEEYGGIKTSIKVVQAITDILTNLKAESLIWEPDNQEDLTIGFSQAMLQPELKQYGLDQPSAVIEFVTVSQEKYTLVLGADAPSSYGKYGWYDGRVYLFDDYNFTYFEKSAKSFIDNQITDSKPLSYQTAKIKLSGTVRPMPITIEVAPNPEKQDSQDDENVIPTGISNYIYTLTDPVERTLSPDVVEPLIDSMFSLYGTWIAVVNPSPEQMVQYGLAQPYSILETNFDGEGFVLKTSKPNEDGDIYIMREGNPVVYGVSSKRVEWLTTQYELLIQAVYTPPKVDEIVSLSIFGEKVSYDFKVNSTDAGGMEVTCNGQEVDAAAFKSLFEAVTPIPPKAYTEQQPYFEPALTMTIRYKKEDRDPDIIKLTPSGDGYLLMTVNGQTNYLTEENIADIILKDCNNVLVGKEISKLS